MGTIKIRHGRKEDIDAITQIEQACFPKAEAADRSVFQNRMAVFPECFFVAEMNDTIIGFINGAVINGKYIQDEMYEKAELHCPNGMYQSVFGIDVKPEYQGKQVASRLMETFIQYARECGKQGVVLTCKEALFPFYKRFGFQNLGRSQSQHGGAIWYDMFLDLTKPISW